MDMMNWISSFLLETAEAPSAADVVTHLKRVDALAAGCRMNPAIWAIGGGKGGVGKSFVTSSFGPLLARNNKKVLLVDADFGAANLHTFFGPEKQTSAFSSFLKGELTDIDEVICNTPLPHVDLISGAHDVLDVADVKGDVLNRLMLALRQTEYDYVLLDVGPGTSSKMLDLMLMSDVGILVCTPDPTSIENTYRFLKALCLRKIKHIIHVGEEGEVRKILKEIIRSVDEKCSPSLMEIFARLKKFDAGKKPMLQRILGNLELNILINQVRNDKEYGLGASMSKACYNYFGLIINSLGYIPYDETISEMIMKRKNFTPQYQLAPFAAPMRRCLEALLQKSNSGGSLKGRAAIG